MVTNGCPKNGLVVLRTELVAVFLARDKRARGAISHLQHPRNGAPGSDLNYLWQDVFFVFAFCNLVTAPERSANGLKLCSRCPNSLDFKAQIHPPRLFSVR